MKKRANYFCVILFILSVSACSEDDEKNAPAYAFQDQIIQGKINGQVWSFKDGNAEVNSFDETKLSIDLGSNKVNDPCGFGATSGLRVFFSIKKELGLKELSSSTEGQTITMYDPEGSLNTISSEGAVELLTITATQVTGRIDAQFDDDNFVNGNFTVLLCER
jgi:hypothetical protein